MSEEIRLSAALLPVQKYYRPLGRHRTRVTIRLVLLALVVYGATWLLGRILLRWVLLPAPEDVTIPAVVVAVLAHLWRYRELPALLR
ncbi:MAG: hypothetical protein NTW87_22935 [Planctomycetota bacterium]|nr:hypothetical protein [Planctomycetota bacterium]